MRRSAILLIFAATLTPAQIHPLAVDDQGRVFFCGPYSLKGEGSDRSQKLFVLDEAGVRLVATPPKDPSFAANLVRPGISSDGSTYAYSIVTDFPAIPGRVSEVEGVVAQATRWFDRELKRPGYAGVSRNGRWALFSQPNASNGQGRSLWINLESEEEHSSPEGGLPVDSIADDGSVAIVEDTALRVLAPGTAPKQIPLGFHATRVVAYSRDGTTAVVQQDEAKGPLPLYSVNIASGRTTQILPDYYRFSPLPIALTADGSRLFFRQDELNGLSSKVHMLDLGYRTRSFLTEVEQDLSAIAVSANANAIWMASAAAGISSLDLNSGMVTELMAETPSISSAPKRIAPGSWFTLSGNALGRARVGIAGQEASIRLQGNRSLIVVADAATPLGDGAIEVLAEASPFNPQPQTITVVRRAPRFLVLFDLGETASYWSSVNVAISAGNGDLINQYRPARPGELVRIYLTGLGPTSDGLDWAYWDEPAQTWRSGLEVVSVERDSSEPAWWVALIRIPASWRAGRHMLACSPSGESGLQTVATLDVAPQ